MRIKDIQHAVVEQDIPVDTSEVPEIVQNFIDKGLVDFVKDSNELLEIPDQMFKSYIHLRSYKAS